MKTSSSYILISATMLSLMLSSCTTNSESAPTPSASVSVDSHGAKWAPEPAHEFTNASCETTPSKDPHFPDKPGLYIAEIDAESLLEEQADLTFPAAPAGMWWTKSSPFGQTSRGATITAGHIDFAPGAISAEGGELSPFWGNLHSEKVAECTHIFATDFNLNNHEYVITDKYTVKQEELATNTQALTHDGLTLITCSGKTLEDVGKKNQFNYENNLSIEAKEIPGDNKAK